jgi:hypothetical protein
VELKTRYVREGGFLHPFIHSGYNPYLTLQLAHAELWQGNIDRAWEIAWTILRQAGTPYSLPEAIHPKTGGGVMGDGHHGWAAAEIILFLRDCLVDDRTEELVLLKGARMMFCEGKSEVSWKGLPTSFGKISLTLTAMPTGGHHFELEPSYFPGRRPSSIVLHLPWISRRVLPSSPSHLLAAVSFETGTTIRFSPDVRSAILLA